MGVYKKCAKQCSKSKCTSIQKGPFDFSTEPLLNAYILRFKPYIIKINPTLSVDDYILYFFMCTYVLFITI